MRLESQNTMRGRDVRKFRCRFLRFFVFEFVHLMKRFSVATEALKNALGDRAVRTDAEALFAVSFDNTKLSFLPEAVVFPQDENDVEKTLKLANEYDVPVTVRGAGSGTTGAAVPVCGGWVISLAHWTKCEIDTDAALAIVQPGVVTQTISDAAREHGLFYPPDPASVKHCTIGGNIATNAGGLRAAKYGVTRDYVVALEGFLPTGEKVRWGGNVRKFVSGYNLRDLWIGAEGTLGIVTQATLRLVPIPEARHTFLCMFEDDASGLRAAQALLRERINPSVLEFMDALSVRCALEEKGESFSGIASGDSVLLVEADGSRAEVESGIERIRAWASSHAKSFRETDVPAEAEKLWEIRRACSPAMFRIADAKLNEDIVVPLENYLPLFDAMREVTRETGLQTPIFGHAADGNFHVHIMYNRENPRECELAQKAIEKVMKAVVDLGGAITGEHGIGLAKSPFLALQHSPAEIAAMRAVKQALDPKNILGRGKIFEPFNVWEHKPVAVKMPWEAGKQPKKQS